MMTQKKGKVCSQTVATPGEGHNVRRVSLVYVEAGGGTPQRACDFQISVCRRGNTARYEKNAHLTRV